MAKETDRETTKALVEDALDARRVVEPAIGTSQETANAWKGTKDDQSYFRARRALRMWPVEGKNDEELWNNTGKFITEILDVSNVGPEDIQTVRRISAGRRSRAHHLVLVRFNDVTARDCVYRNAPRLATHVSATGVPTAGLMLEIPDHLLGSFKTLQRHGHRLRELHGPDFKRHVRLCDEERDIRLDAKFPGDSEWQCITVELAKQIDREERVKSRDRLLARMSSSDSTAGSRSSRTSVSTMEDEVFTQSQAPGTSRDPPRESWGSWRKSNNP